MILARKADDRNVYLKLTFLEEEINIEEGFERTYIAGFHSVQEESLHGDGEKVEKKTLGGRYPSRNETVKRILESIAKGNCDEVEFSRQFVKFPVDGDDKEDSASSNYTTTPVAEAVSACLLCEDGAKRRAMLAILLAPVGGRCLSWRERLRTEMHRHSYWRRQYNPDNSSHRRSGEGGPRDPIHWCCARGLWTEFKAVAEAALAWDLDFHRPDQDGNCYLHLAVLTGVLPIVRSLCEHMHARGVSGDVTNDLGLTPYLLSRKLGRREISRCLEQTGVVSAAACDSVTHRTPREWSILGQADRNVNDDPTLAPVVRISSSREPISHLDLNDVIHRAYNLWSLQNVDSFRRFIAPRSQRNLNTTKKIALPPIPKKSRVR